jgi:hypothetical protein
VEINDRLGCYFGRAALIVGWLALVLGMLFDEFIDQVHGLQRFRRQPLEASFCVLEGRQIPFRLLSGVDVA